MTMLPLYLLASHLVGDFVFQTRWQADGKFGWETDAVALRTAHAFFYGVAFLPVVFWRCFSGPSPWHAPAFFALLILLHWLTDSRRFQATVGDYAGWWLTPLPQRRAAWQEWGRIGSEPPNAVQIPDDYMTVPPPNPWPTLPLAIDQTLHVVQIAVLAGLFL